MLNYTNASYLLDEQYSFDVNEGIFSGFNEETATYDNHSWHYQVESTKTWDTSEGGAYAWAAAPGVPEFTPPTVEVPKRDMTLQDPMCVFQQMKKHYSRYDLDTVSSVCGMDKDLLEKVYALSLIHIWQDGPGRGRGRDRGRLARVVLRGRRRRGPGIRGGPCCRGRVVRGGRRVRLCLSLIHI